jgi:hypothetical protein
MNLPKKYYATFLFILLIISSSQGIGQSLGNAPNLGSWITQIYVGDVDGMRAGSGYKDISGSPFFNEDYKFGSITLKSGHKFSNVEFRIDIASHLINFVATEKEQLHLPAKFVKSVSYIDSSALNNPLYVFITGMPAIDGHKPDDFFQVLSDGKLVLLKSINKRIDVQTNPLNGRTSREFIFETSYYVYNGSKIVKLKKDKDFILTLMEDKKTVMTSFLHEIQVSLKDEVSLKTIFDRYNHL